MLLMMVMMFACWAEGSLCVLTMLGNDIAYSLTLSVTRQLMMELMYGIALGRPDVVVERRKVQYGKAV